MLRPQRPTRATPAALWIDVQMPGLWRSERGKSATEGTFRCRQARMPVDTDPFMTGAGQSSCRSGTLAAARGSPRGNSAEVVLLELL